MRPPHMNRLLRYAFVCYVHETLQHSIENPVNPMEPIHTPCSVTHIYLPTAKLITIICKQCEYAPFHVYSDHGLCTTKINL